MRIVAGRLRGSILDAPPGQTTRPITDRVKESLFSILGHRFGTLGDLPPFDVLDLFAGSGSLGIESLSRGARSCLFVEHDKRSLRTLKNNLNRLRLGPDARVCAENAWTLRIVPARAGGFGLVFVDPPYRDAADVIRLRDLLVRLAPRLARDGLLVFRLEVAWNLPLHELPQFECVDERIYGRMRLLLLRRSPEIPGEPTSPRESFGRDEAKSEGPDAQADRG